MEEQEKKGLRPETSGADGASHEVAANNEAPTDGDRIVDEDGTRWTVTPENRMAVTRMVWVKWLRKANKNATTEDHAI